ncbi:MAG: hypothetical protein ACK4I8_03945 [Armatimonadota bacterium]
MQVAESRRSLESASPDAPMPISIVGGALAPNFCLCYLSRLKPLLPQFVATKVAPTEKFRLTRMFALQDRNCRRLQEATLHRFRIRWTRPPSRVPHPDKNRLIRMFAL